MQGSFKGSLSILIQLQSAISKVLETKIQKLSLI